MTLPQLRRLLPGLLRRRRLLLLGLLALALTTALSVAGPWVLRHAIDDLTLAVTRQKLWLYAGPCSRSSRSRASSATRCG